MSVVKILGKYIVAKQVHMPFFAVYMNIVNVKL